MMALILFPDVELVTVTYLRAALALRTEDYKAGVVVGTRVPSTRPVRLVTVRRDGGPRLDVAREAARIGVNVWAGTEQDASDLANLVRALLWAAPNGAPICRVTEISGPSPVVDASGSPLRYMTFELICRGADAA